MGLEKCTTTDKDFKLFQTECEKWVKKFGLVGWEITYKHDDEFEDHCATSVIYQEQRFCDFHLSKEMDWNDKLTSYDICTFAAEEVLHLLISNLVDLITERVVTDSTIKQEEHNLIKILMNVFMKQDFAKKK